jgi:uncharacterized protein
MRKAGSRLRRCRGGPTHTVEDIEAAQKRVIDAGGKVLLPPMDVPGGSRILQATDDQNGHFALMQGPKS